MAKKKANGSATMPSISDVTKDIEADSTGAQEALIFIERIEITDQERLRGAVQVAAELKDRSDVADAKRRSWVDPLNAVVTDINKTFRPLLESLKKGESILKSKIVEYSNRLEIKRSCLLEEAGKSDNADALLKEADRCISDKVPGLAIKSSWDGEVIDPDRIIKWAIANNRLDLLLPDAKALKAQTKARGMDPKIDGWKAYPKSSVAITVSKVER